MIRWHHLIYYFPAVSYDTPTDKFGNHSESLFGGIFSSVPGIGVRVPHDATHRTKIEFQGRRRRRRRCRIVDGIERSIATRAL